MSPARAKLVAMELRAEAAERRRVAVNATAEGRAYLCARADEIEKKARQIEMSASDRDGAEGGDANAAPVPQDRQARAEGIAK